MQVQPTDAEIAWAAGLFEGEGCFSVNRNASVRAQMHVSLSMTDRDIVERFLRIVDCGTIRTRGQASADHRKPVYEWHLYAAPKIRRLVDLLFPWLGERRRTKALEMLQVGSKVGLPTGERTHCPQGHPYEGDNVYVTHRTNGVVTRACRTCARAKNRERWRAKKGITPDRYRVLDVVNSTSGATQRSL